MWFATADMRSSLLYYFAFQTGTAGGNGGYAAAHVLLRDGATLKACVGDGGLGGRGAGEVDGQKGARGFAKVTLLA